MRHLQLILGGFFSASILTSFSACRSGGSGSDVKNTSASTGPVSVSCQTSNNQPSYRIHLSRNSDGRYSGDFTDTDNDSKVMSFTNVLYDPEDDYKVFRGNKLSLGIGNTAAPGNGGYLGSLKVEPYLRESVKVVCN